VIEIGTAEIVALIGGIGLAIKVIDKLVDAVLAKTNKGARAPLTNGAMREVADGLRAVASAQAAVTAKLDRLCELSEDMKAQHIRQDEALERRFDALHRRLDRRVE
jgi:hypothetical protein